MLTRRAFLAGTPLALPITRVFSQIAESPLRFGIVTDAHYADAPTRGTRWYRESLEKMNECVDSMNRQSVDFFIELGDLKDEDVSPNEQNTLRYLAEIEAVVQTFEGPTYHVLGNHDMDSISKSQCLSRIHNTGIDSERSYYSFDLKGIHFVVLDANFRGDGIPYDHGNFDWTEAFIPPQEIAWLRNDLREHNQPTVAFVHQLLDGEGDVYIKNADEIRRILEQSRTVVAVFQGHHHPGRYSRIDGIHYYTLKGMIEGSGPENNAYAIVTVTSRQLIVEGYRKAESISESIL